MRLAYFVIGHAWDIYGQMAVYLRLNGIVPPAREPTLYYGDPEYYLDFCQRHLSLNSRLIEVLNPREFIIFAMH